MSHPVMHHLDKQAIPLFAHSIAQWQKKHGRHGLPWQHNRDPYRIWLAEIMLQQTQVRTVLGYYERFLQRFPDVYSLAQASQEEVMPYWAGLGYYARARHLHRCAQIIVSEYGGAFPRTQAQLKTLPGIGPSTAAAIAAFAFGERISILDGNVKRVLARFAGVFAPLQRSATEKELWAMAQQFVAAAPDTLDMTAYTQGLMDLGALLCTRHQAQCSACPVRTHCYAYTQQCVPQLPVPNPPRTYPTRRRHMLIWLGADHQLLLQRRPNQGIWGGLVSLPEFTSRTALRAFCHSSTIKPPQRRLQPLEVIRHRLTHFALEIHPWLLHTPTLDPRTLPCASSSDLLWIPAHHYTQQALPAPIERLLASLLRPIMNLAQEPAHD